MVEQIPKLSDLMRADYPSVKFDHNRLVVGTYVVKSFEIVDVPAQNFKQAANLNTEKGKYSTTSKNVVGQLKGKIGTMINAAIKSYGACEIEIVERKYPNGNKGIGIKAF